MIMFHLFFYSSHLVLWASSQQISTQSPLGLDKIISLVEYFPVGCCLVYSPYTFLLSPFPFQVKDTNLAKYCKCAGDFTNCQQRDEFADRMKTVRNVARYASNVTN